MSDEPATNTAPITPPDEPKVESPETAHTETAEATPEPVAADAVSHSAPEPEVAVEEEAPPKAPPTPEPAATTPEAPIPEPEPEPTPAEETSSEPPTPAPDVAEPASEEQPESPPEPTEPAEPAEPAAKPAKRTRKKAATSAATATATATDPTSTVTATAVEEATENKKKWYAIKVQSGREDTIKGAIMRKVAIEGLEEFVGQIVIPVEEVVEKKQVKVKDKKTGDTTYQEKKVTRKKKKFHGYIFAELEFNDRILYLFRETSGVGDFLNMRGKPPVPEPMPDHEVQSMLTGVSVKDPSKKSTKIKIDFEKGDRVKIRDGSFANQEGEVKSIAEPKDPTDAPKVTVTVTLWGRPVDVELEYWQVEKA